MKKIYIIYTSLLALFVSSCADLDINDDPNYPSSSAVTTDLVFPAVENFIADAIGDQMFNYGGFFAQYFDQMPSANQYNDLAELNIDESSDLFRRCYSNLYAGALADIKDILSRTENTSDIYACTVLRVQAFQLLVDNMSDAPYEEALAGASIPAPKWDDGEKIYKEVLAELDKAEAALGAEVMTLTDPMMNKSMAQWKGYANALRLRMYLRLIDGNIDTASYTAKVKQLISDNKFFTGDITWDVYSPSEGQYNPWFGAYNSLGAKNHCAAYPIVSYYTFTDDPRIDYAITKATKTNDYIGQLPGCKTLLGDWMKIGSLYNGDYVSNIQYAVTKSAPIYLFTQAELQFLIAECELRFNDNKEEAEKAYKAGVTSDFNSRGISGAAEFLSNSLVSFASKKTPTDKLNLIYMQKWAALFMRDHMEAWSEMRRTDIPSLSSVTAKDIYNGSIEYQAGQMIEPGVNYIQAGGLAKRVPYPSSARQLNKNTPAAKLLSDRVFWDAK